MGHPTNKIENCGTPNELEQVETRAESYALEEMRLTIEFFNPMSSATDCRTVDFNYAGGAWPREWLRTNLVVRL